ncbi:hypothetical protein IW261DRAFT_1424481 [Armillaria novae-zelandiae]|uniref:CxC2-like cysteine cluster KDZ transposase-associated domain-containing protein n=1 Tax=Armillaria novae-zelandiae TaxID=153914 RepID=A0AA39U7B9_9AGAR|nr:hypothetical protein IW261DRAFT_1424481 [Armillaria novae-zelandiae]
MTEQPWNQNFTHAGLAPKNCKNAISFHLYKTKHTFFANVLLDFIYKDFVLYWPPEDHSDEGLLRLCECIRNALWFLFNALDAEVHEQQSKLTPQLYSPGPLENQHSTIPCSKVLHPIKIDFFDITQEQAKAMAIHAIKKLKTAREDIWLEATTFVHGASHKLNIVQEYLFFQEHATQPSQPHSSPLWLCTTLPNQSDNDWARTAMLPSCMSWSFPGPSGGSSSVKQSFVNLLVLPQKKTTIISLALDDLSQSLQGLFDALGTCDTSHEQYHLDPEAYTLAMAGDMENIATASRRCVYMVDDYLAEKMQGNFASCMHEHPLAAQLQCAWLFPATGIEPHTAVTTAALEQFQMLTFMGKISAYEYYYSLAWLTDNTNTKTPSLKRAGISNDPGGWKSAKLVSCAVKCLDCPWLGVNIPHIIDPKSPDAMGVYSILGHRWKLPLGEV